ncbi:hypothetical protein [Thermomonospora catenispora]|uniref:hypothetical protein n=1 Tax=Thermomonospora catenispora TaxID=2493090 RepID=UPI00111E373A|nr:hypothetical protein [Thermomonospora catenispora]TNY34546.1 hypothetical protein EIO00_23175 [Thermomonospora catenispora]
MTDIPAPIPTLEDVEGMPGILLTGASAVLAAPDGHVVLERIPRRLTAAQAADLARALWAVHTHLTGPTRDETPRPVTAPAATPSADTDPTRDEESVTETEWEERRRVELAEFERRLKPLPEFGDGYQVATWPGTGHHYLVYRGERIGYAAKRGLTSMWEARTPEGHKIPYTGTYKTRRDALIQVALHQSKRHQSTG